MGLPWVSSWSSFSSAAASCGHCSPRVPPRSPAKPHGVGPLWPLVGVEWGGPEQCTSPAPVQTNLSGETRSLCSAAGLAAWHRDVCLCFILKHAFILLEELVRLGELQKNICIKASVWWGAALLSQVGARILKEVVQKELWQVWISSFGGLIL